VGKLVYTQWLNPRGGIEADVTITRLSETSFMVVTIASSQRRDMAWLKRHIPDDAHVFAVDVTSGLRACRHGTKVARLARGGQPGRFFQRSLPLRDQPRNRPRLCAGTGQPGHVRRRTGLGTLHSRRIRHARLRHAGRGGRSLQPRPCRLFRAQFAAHGKGYRHWSHDIGEEDTPLEGGLGFAVAFDKPGGFIGREALLRQKEAGNRAAALSSCA
jgi:4-methylaminobutanoate oxidase (formaldehyde-forming)